MNAPADILMANLSAPEMSYLAAEFSRRGRLRRYVRRYANQQRWWERTLQRIPALGALYTRTLGLRYLPEGLQPDHVAQAGVLHDFAAAIAGRIGLPRHLAIRASASLHRGTMRAVERKAARLAAAADIVIAGSGMAYEAFRACAPGARRVLNYSSAYHGFQKTFFAEAAERQPEFARLVEGDAGLSAAAEEQLDEECGMADLLLTGSSFARDSFRGAPFGARTRAVPYGVDTSRFPAGNKRAPDGKFRIAYVGRISARKGIGYLLHAYRRFRRADTELQLVGAIMGDASCLQPYRELFSHVPHLPQFMLPEIYRGADVFVFPTLLEGMGLVVLEAMACGCPVIVTDHGPNDVVRDGIDGFVVPAADDDALEQALDRLYRDRELCRSMGESARLQALKYNWQRYAADAADAVLDTAAAGANPSGVVACGVC